MNDDAVLFGECKWGAVDRHDAKRLRMQADRFLAELDGSPKVYFAMFSASEIDDDELARQVAEGEVFHFGLDDLFGNEEKVDEVT